jgi:hypothetical protein
MFTPSINPQDVIFPLAPLWKKEEWVFFTSLEAETIQPEAMVSSLKNIEITARAKNVFFYENRETSGTTKIVILPSTIFDNLTTNEQIRSFAKQFGLKTPEPDLAGHIIKSFSGQNVKNMGLKSLVIMHNPIPCYDDDNDLNLLAIELVDKKWTLCTEDGSPDYCWAFKGDQIGFTFVL